MNYKTFLSGEPFRSQIRLCIFGCVNNSITSLVLLVVILVLSKSFADFLGTLQSQVGRIFSISIFIVVIFNLFALDIDVIKNYFSSPPIISEDDESLNTNSTEKFIFGYAVPLGVSIFMVIVFVWGYLIEGEGWDNMLRRTSLTFLPFPIAFVVMCLSVIAVHAGWLTLGYIVQRNRY